MVRVNRTFSWSVAPPLAAARGGSPTTSREQLDQLDLLHAVSRRWKLRDPNGLLDIFYRFEDYFDPSKPQYLQYLVANGGIDLLVRLVCDNCTFEAATSSNRDENVDTAYTSVLRVITELLVCYNDVGWYIYDLYPGFFFRLLDLCTLNSIREAAIAVLEHLISVVGPVFEIATTPRLQQFIKSSKDSTFASICRILALLVVPSVMADHPGEKQRPEPFQQSLTRMLKIHRVVDSNVLWLMGEEGIIERLLRLSEVQDRGFRIHQGNRTLTLSFPPNEMPANGQLSGMDVFMRMAALHSGEEEDDYGFEDDGLGDEDDSRDFGRESRSRSRSSGRRPNDRANPWDGGAWSTASRSSRTSASASQHHASEDVQQAAGASEPSSDREEDAGVPDIDAPAGERHRDRSSSTGHVRDPVGNVTEDTGEAGDLLGNLFHAAVPSVTGAGPASPFQASVGNQASSLSSRPTDRSQETAEEREGGPEGSDASRGTPETPNGSTEGGPRRGSLPGSGIDRTTLDRLMENIAESARPTNLIDSIDFGWFIGSPDVRERWRLNDMILTEKDNNCHQIVGKSCNEYRAQWNTFQEYVQKHSPSIEGLSMRQAERDTIINSQSELLFVLHAIMTTFPSMEAWAKLTGCKWIKRANAIFDSAFQPSLIVLSPVQSVVERLEISPGLMALPRFLEDSPEVLAEEARGDQEAFIEDPELWSAGTKRKSDEFLENDNHQHDPDTMRKLELLRMTQEYWNVQDRKELQRLTLCSAIRSNSSLLAGKIANIIITAAEDPCTELSACHAVEEYVRSFSFHCRSNPELSSPQDTIGKQLLDYLLTVRVYNATKVPGVCGSMVPMKRLGTILTLLGELIKYHPGNLMRLQDYVAGRVDLSHLNDPVVSLAQEMFAKLAARGDESKEQFLRKPPLNRTESEEFSSVLLRRIARAGREAAFLVRSLVLSLTPNLCGPVNYVWKPEDWASVSKLSDLKDAMHSLVSKKRKVDYVTGQVRRFAYLRYHSRTFVTRIVNGEVVIPPAPTLGRKYQFFYPTAGIPYGARINRHRTHPPVWPGKRSGVIVGGETRLTLLDMAELVLDAPHRIPREQRAFPCLLDDADKAILLGKCGLPPVGAPAHLLEQFMLSPGGRTLAGGSHNIDHSQLGELADRLLSAPHKLIYDLIGPLNAELVENADRLCSVTTALLVFMREAVLHGEHGIHTTLRNLVNLAQPPFKMWQEGLPAGDSMRGSLLSESETDGRCYFSFNSDASERSNCDSDSWETEEEDDEEGYDDECSCDKGGEGDAHSPWGASKCRCCTYKGRETFDADGQQDTHGAVDRTYHSPAASLASSLQYFFHDRHGESTYHIEVPYRRIPMHDEDKSTDEESDEPQQLMPYNMYYGASYDKPHTVGDISSSSESDYAATADGPGGKHYGSGHAEGTAVSGRVRRDKPRRDTQAATSKNDASDGPADSNDPSYDGDFYDGDEGSESTLFCDGRCHGRRTEDLQCMTFQMCGDCDPPSLVTDYYFAMGGCLFRNFFRLLWLWLGHYGGSQAYIETLYYYTEVPFAEYKSIVLYLLRVLPYYFFRL